MQPIKNLHRIIAALLILILSAAITVAYIRKQVAGESTHHQHEERGEPMKTHPTPESPEPKPGHEH